MKRSIHLLLIIYTLASCHTSQSDQSPPSEAIERVLEPTISFGKVGEKAIALDSMTVWHPYVTQFLEIEGKGCLAIFNEPDYSIKLYEYATGSLVDVIPIQKKGPNAITNFHDFHMLSTDSILVITHSWELCLIDRGAEIQWKIPLYNDNEIYAVSFRHAFFPLFQYERKFYMGILTVFDYDDEIHVYVDLEQKESGFLRQVNGRLDQYIDHFASIDEYMEWTYAIDEKRGRIIYNFPNLDSLYMGPIGNWDNGHLKAVYAGSTQFRHPIKPLINYTRTLRHTRMEQRFASQEEIKREVLSRPIYNFLLRDPYKDRFYRITGLPISKEVQALKDPVLSKEREYSIMVLDSAFNLLDEIVLPRGQYEFFNLPLFVSPQGLHLLRKAKDEDTMVFDIFGELEDVR